jgi:hypothetical protein
MSSKILTPHPPAGGECVMYPPPLVRRRTHSLGGEGGGAWGVNILEDADTALYSTYVSTLWHILTLIANKCIIKYEDARNAKC